MKKEDEIARLNEILSEIIKCIKGKTGEKNLQDTQILELTLEGDICKFFCPDTGRCKFEIEDGQIVNVVCLD